MRTLLFILALALPAFAETDLDALAARLADDDPAVRDAARKEFLTLDENDVPRVEKLLVSTRDPEAAAALREIADELRDRPFRDEARRLARAAQRGEDISPELGRLGPKALRVCHYWLAHADSVVPDERDRDPWERGGRTTPENVAEEATAWAGAWTFQAAGTNSLLQEVVDRVSCGELEEVRFAALEARGFAVRSPHPAVRAAAWRGAAIEFGRDSRGSAAQAANRLLWQHLVQRFDSGSLLTSDSTEENLDRLRCWIAANSRELRESEGRITSFATRDSLVERVSSDDPYTRSGAIRILAMHPDWMPENGWTLLRLDSQQAFRLVAYVRGRPDIDSIGALLEKTGPRWDDPVLNALWDPAVLAAFAARAGNPELRARALRVLSLHGTASSVESALTMLRDVSRVPEADQALVCGAAALVVARLGSEADLPLAEWWASPASRAVDRRDIAWALARRGNAAGFRGMLAAVRDEWLFPEEVASLREFVEETPAAGPGWKDWVDTWGEKYGWNAAAKKWVRAK